MKKVFKLDDFGIKELQDYLDSIKRPAKGNYQAVIRSPSEIRSIEQNKLQRLWLNEAAEQLGEYTAEYYRGMCKLHFGIPILIAASDEYRKAYNTYIRPLTYEQRINMMMLPMDYPVTRGMTTKQKAEYLDVVKQHFLAQGVNLTDPYGR